MRDLDEGPGVGTNALTRGSPGEKSPVTIRDDRELNIVRAGDGD
jgi:hypothetical protein